MFCTNCGKDCGDSKFCSNCGTRIQNMEDKEVKQAAITGVICPHCGGMEFKDGCCAFCGVRLTSTQRQDSPMENVSANIPCGKYDGFVSSLTLYERECVICNRVGLFKQYKTRIPYNKLTTVAYVRKKSGFGFLLLRWEGNQNMPIPDISEWGKDPTTVSASNEGRTLFFNSDKTKHIDAVDGNTFFYHIFYMLKSICPNTVTFRMEVLGNDAAEMNEIAAKTDLSTYFERFAPHRDLAVKEMRERTGVAQDVAARVINQIFDERQKQIYSIDPTAALQDLNLIVAEQKRRETLARQYRQEADEERRKNEILYELRKRE